MIRTFELNIVSQEQQIYCGGAIKLFVTSVYGELEILYGHAKLLAQLAPAPVWIEKPDFSKEALVVFGGVIEVQPKKSIILADTAIRAVDLDEVKALTAKRDAEYRLHQGSADYRTLRAEINFARAQLRVIKHLLRR